MKTTTAITACLGLTLAIPLPADVGNPNIDYDAFARLTTEVAAERESRRISEEEFIEMAADEGTVILDTRSKAKFDQLHVKGAIHLNFSDFTEESLTELIPDKTTRILIYCNNNFDGAGEPMVTKSAPLALNIPTFLNLWGYGYRNVYELRPNLDFEETKIPFEGSDVLNPGGE